MGNVSSGEMPTVFGEGSAPNERSLSGRALPPALVVAALGVVFGDIGTSPLYALAAVFSIDHGAVEPVRENVLCIISMLFWTVLLIVSIKYVTLVLRADNDGEGGIIALAALARRGLTASGPRVRAWVVLAGIVGAGLFYGDSVITPAISVLSAVEGVEIAAPQVGHFVVPIAVVIVVVLFLAQPRGTERIGRVFGPVMLLWFVVLAALGVPAIIEHPGVLVALSPTFLIAFVIAHPLIAFIAMGAVVLSVTGAEALYADLGHFGRRSIAIAWYGVVFPALMINYLGQGALIINNPASVDNPFFRLAPGALVLPLVVLATAATVIASQAVISGAFSMTKQAMRFGLFPRLAMRYTSAHNSRHVYLPTVNWALLIGVLVLVLIFRGSSRLSSAYGLAVTGTFILTTILLLIVARTQWGWSWRWIALLGIGLGGVEMTYWVANLTKFLNGGYLPVAVAVVLTVSMVTWQRGRAEVTRDRSAIEGPIEDFFAGLGDAEVYRVPGTAVYLHASPVTIPLALRDNMLFNHILHEQVVVVTVANLDIPRVAPEDLLEIDSRYASVGILRVTLRQGFLDPARVPEMLHTIGERIGIDHADLESAPYFLSGMNVSLAPQSRMPTWQRRLFIAMVRNSQVPTFGLPASRVVIVGSDVPI